MSSKISLTRYLVEQQRILDLQPTKLHERVSVILGSKNEVERVTAYHSKL